MLALAQRNVADHGLQDRINLIRSDLLSNLTEKTYDLIICNPPYVTAMAMEELPAEYRHEPALALAGGDDGLDAVRIVLAKAPQFLAPDGLLVVEIGHNRATIENRRLPDEMSSVLLTFPRFCGHWIKRALPVRGDISEGGMKPLTIALG